MVDSPVKLSRVESMSAKLKPLLSEATLEQIDLEIRKTSTCIVMDKDEILEASNWIEMYSGKIRTFLEDISGKPMKIECTFRQMVKASEIAHAQCGDMDQFVKNARSLAVMLEKAAKRVERNLGNY